MADRIRVLYVDDHAGSLDSRRDSLRTEYGFEVVTATDVDAAMERVEAGSIDCIVDSLELTGNDGFDLLERVSADHPDLPVILLTGHEPGRGPEETVRRAYERGATDIIPRALISTSDDLLAQRIELAVGRSRHPNGESDPIGPDRLPTDPSLVDTTGFQWMDGFVRIDGDSTDVIDPMDDGIIVTDDGIVVTDDGIVVTEDGSVYEYVRSALGRLNTTGEDPSKEPGDGTRPFSDGSPGGSERADRTPISPVQRDDGGSPSDDTVARYVESLATSDPAESAEDSVAEVLAWVRAGPGSTGQGSTGQGNDSQGNDGWDGDVSRDRTGGGADPVFDSVASAIAPNGESAIERSPDSSVESIPEPVEELDDGSTLSDDVRDPIVDLGEDVTAEFDEVVDDDDLRAIIEEIRSGNGSVDLDRENGPIADERVNHGGGPLADSTDDGHEREDGTATSSGSRSGSASAAKPGTDESNEGNVGIAEPNGGDAGSLGSSNADQPAVEGPETVQASAGKDTASAGGEAASAGGEAADAGSGSMGWGTADAYRRPAEFDTEPGGSVLIQCGSHDDREHAACFDLLGGRRTTGTHVLMVRYREMNGTRLERIATSAKRMTIVSIGFVQPVPENVRDVVETVKINNPNDVTRLGIVVTGTVNSWKGTADRIVVCVHPLNVLLQYKSSQSVFRFLHILLGKLRSADAISHFHVDPTAGDPQDINTLKPLFDSVLTIDSVGVDLENT